MNPRLSRRLGRASVIAMLTLGLVLGITTTTAVARATLPGSTAQGALTVCVNRSSDHARVLAGSSHRCRAGVERRSDGSGGLHYRGSWRTGRVYHRFDVVSYKGGSYLAKRRSRARVPATRHKYWAVLALPGRAGVPGNANVVSRTVTLASSDFAWNSGFEFSNSTNSWTTYFTRYADISMPAITQGVLDSGAVQVFFTPSSNLPDAWVPLPFSIMNVGGYQTNYMVQIMAGRVRVHYFWSAGSSPAPTGLDTFLMPTLKYRVVVTAGAPVS